MDNYIEVNKNAYNALADQYYCRLKNTSKYQEPLDRLVGLPLKYAQMKFDKISTLEIGSGNGSVSLYLEQRGCKTVAIDIAEKMLDVVRKTSSSTQTIHSDILDYKIPQNEYELIYCGALIHLFTLSDAKKILQNINKGLKSSGILFINTTCHEKSSEGFFVKRDYCGEVKRFRHKYTKNEFKTLVEFCGFRILDKIESHEKDRKKHWINYVCEKV